MKYPYVPVQLRKTRTTYVKSIRVGIYEAMQTWETSTRSIGCWRRVHQVILHFRCCILQHDKQNDDNSGQPLHKEMHVCTN